MSGNAATPQAGNAPPRSAAAPGLSLLALFFALPVQDADLAISQCTALSRQVPVLYTILLINAFALASTHYATAPHWLVVIVPAVLLLISGARIVTWLRDFGRVYTGAEALRQLRFTLILTGIMGCLFTAWSLSLYPYGDAYDKCHVAYYMSITVVSCILCLMHLRSAALLLTFVVVVPFGLFFASTGQPVLVAIAVNMVLVTFGIIFVMQRNYGDFTSLILSQRELTVRQQETQRLSDENMRLANLDSLSSLPNRRRFFGELDARLAAADREGCWLAVVLLDLDRFKGVNDLFGHAAGDRLLTQVGLRLKRLASDTVFFARLGGDEFGAILTACDTPDAVSEFGEELRTLLAGPCVVGDRLATISCSIGVAVFPQAGHTAEELFERADYALYYGKQTRPGGMVIFSDEHETAIRSSGRIEHALRTADLEAEMWLAFQPVIDVAQNRVVAFEALARWRSPELGDVRPDAFIPVAEKAQMIGRMTETLLAKAIAAARLWPAGVGLCFNLSAKDLINADTMAKVRELTQSGGLAPARIEFEVTETALLQDFDRAAAAIETLHKLGARVALDDFGTGFSSLGYVHRLKLDKIKIDRSFVADVDVSRTAPSIIKTIVDLCRNLELDCVVEGVETKAQLDVIVSLGCRFIQGYLFSRPVPGDAVTRLIAQLEPAAAVCEAAALPVQALGNIVS